MGRVAKPLLLAGLWIFFLRSAWPASDLFRSVPKGPDTLEVLWALQWYRQAIAEGRSPFFYPLAFAPLGWHTPTLAHTPLLIGLMLPWSVLGGEAFAFNIMGWIAMTLAFGGAYRLSLRFSRDPWIAFAAGLAYAFTNTAYSRLREFGGHLHVMLGFALLPWFIIELERARSQGWHRRVAWRAGILWGLAAGMHLQMLAIGLIPALVYLVRKTISRREIGGAAILITSALFLAGPWLILFRWSFEQDQMQPHTVELVKDVGYDWGFAFQWNPYHPARAIIGAASGLPRIAPIGLTPWIISGLGLLGLWGTRRGPLRSGRMLAVAGVGAMMATGILLQWRGPITIPWPSWLVMAYEQLWRFGYHLNPLFFETPDVPEWLIHRAHSPLFMFVVPAPLLGYAPALIRWMSLFVLGMIVAGSEAISRAIHSRPVRALVLIPWFVECYSVGAAGWPWPFPTHPAYEWLRKQPGEGMIVELAPPSLLRSSAALLATLAHRKPIVNGWGSFYPKWFVKLDMSINGSLDRIWRTGPIGVRYLVLHSANPGGPDIPAPREFPSRCFDPLPIESPWEERICVIDLSAYPLHQVTNLWLLDGWSGLEEWGFWAAALQSEAVYLAPQAADLDLEIQAFPFCPADIPQRITMFINGREMDGLTFSNCAEAHQTISIPGDWIRRGWNSVTFRFAYARSPAQATGGRNPDSRTLAVGFRKLWVHVRGSPPAR